MITHVGIDMGTKGSICSIDETGIVSFEDMDVSKGIFNYEGMAALMLGILGKAQLTVEELAPFSKTNAYTCFRMGETQGAIRALIAACGLNDCLWIKPLVWKKAYGLIGTAKKASIQKAHDVAKENGMRFLKPKLRHDDADAFLIAMYPKLF